MDSRKELLVLTLRVVVASDRGHLGVTLACRPGGATSPRTVGPRNCRRLYLPQTKAQDTLRSTLSTRKQERPCNAAGEIEDAAIAVAAEEADAARVEEEAKEAEDAEEGGGAAEERQRRVST